MESLCRTPRRRCSVSRSGPSPQRFLAFNTIIFFALSLLTSVNLSVGVGFGLFAIFSVLRYRTDEIPIREMTYLFVIIALPVMNSVLMTSGDVRKLIIANGLMVGVPFVLEKQWGFHFEGSKKVIYEPLDLITAGNGDALLADLRARTGLPVKRAEVGRIDFSSDTADVQVYYDEPKGGTRAVTEDVVVHAYPSHSQKALESR